MELAYEIRIGKERISVLIGKDGEIKKRIESSTNTNMQINSEGDIFIKGADGLGLYTAVEVIKAIGRGFNPDVSLLLLKPDYLFEVIDITNYAGKSKNAIVRIKGRIIGESGRCRKNIELLTDTNISIYGKTVGIIGETSNVLIAKVAVELLAQGSPHSNVYRWLEKKRIELKRKAILGEDIELTEEAKKLDKIK